MRFGQRQEAARAATYTPGEGKNECSAFKGFGNCELNGSPTIIKFDDSLEVEDKNGLFPSIDGSEFTFDVDETDDEGGILSFFWTYTPGLNDPFLTAIALKGGKEGWAWTSTFDYIAGVYSGFLSMEEAGLVNDKGKPQALSHVTFFDTGTPPSEVPLPAARWLMLAGIGGLAALRRRKA